MSDTESEIGEPQYTLIYDDALDTPESFVSHDGTAVATFANGDKYTGGYLRGLRHGRGNFIFAKGGSYEGEYEAGLRHGQGTFRAPDNSVYVGGWVEGKKSGYGEYIYSNGDTYKGEWKFGKKNGKGTYVSISGNTTFAGTWSNDKLVQATVELGNKSSTKLFANFNAEGKPHGNAIYFHPNKRITAGEYINGHWVPHRYLDVNKDSTTLVNQSDNPVQPSKELQQAERVISRVLLCADADDSIERLKKDITGAPNFRRNGEWPIYACAQPTTTGISSIITKVTEESFSKIVFVLVRTEPVIYVESSSYGPRHPRAVRHALHFNLAAADLGNLENNWKKNIQTTLVQEQGALNIQRSTYADYEDDCAVLPLRLDLAVDTSVQTTTEVISAACEESGIEFEIERIPFLVGSVESEMTFLSSVADLSSKVSEEEGTAVVIIDAYGRLPTTVTSASFAVFRAVAAAISARNEAKEAAAAESTEAEEVEETNEDTEEEENEEDAVEKQETEEDPDEANSEATNDESADAEQSANPEENNTQVEESSSNPEQTDVPTVLEIVESVPEPTEFISEDLIAEISQQNPIARCSTIVSRIFMAAKAHESSNSTLEGVLASSSTMIHLRDSLEYVSAQFAAAQAPEVQHFWTKHAKELVQHCFLLAALTAYAESEAERIAAVATAQTNNAETEQDEEQEEGSNEPVNKQDNSFNSWLLNPSQELVRKWIQVGVESFNWV